ncbi:MAG: hypothetical protein OES69_17880 [Myxococcales bacterium]|nr:hypothetical protein [Myxococcales bacterium]MDH3845813.1 hypothetical protein [Myxococcales bacterium]
MLHLVVLLALALATVSCSSGGDGGYTPATETADLCETPLAPTEPLCSAAFGDTIWAASHRSSYAQGSSAFPGPAAGATVTSAHLAIPSAGVPVIMSFSEPYDDGGRAVWSTVTGVDGAIVKVDHQTFELVDTYIPAEREDSAPTITLGISGAYTAIDAQNRFIVGRSRFVSFFGDSAEGDRASPIELKQRIFMPDEVFCNDNDIIAGMSLTYGGDLAFATELGNVFVIPANANPTDLGQLPIASANPDCGTADPANLEIVSNSIAADENGGIYLVTSAAMYRYQWDGTALEQAWRAEYETVEKPCAIRLGPGSGSTPSLMGTAADDDRFVVITDGQDLMHLVLFWRDEIPEAWEPIAPGKDRRIACEIPIRFGVPEATESCSEQSVAVRGYSAVVVNDLLRDPTINDSSMSLALAQNLVSALEGGIPEKAPFGFERIDWDPQSQTCASIWANTTVSVPNGIPSISEASGLVYGIGQRDGQWGLEGLDLDTGESVLWAPAGPGTCDPALTRIVGLLPGVSEVLEQVPNSCENSIYSATTVGPDSTVYTGTLIGMSRYTPDAMTELLPEAQIIAGLEQGSDLLTRAEMGARPGGISVRDYLRRALVQLGAADVVARETGLAEMSMQFREAQRAVDRAVQALDAGNPIDAELVEARAAIDAASNAL